MKISKIARARCLHESPQWRSRRHRWWCNFSARRRWSKFRRRAFSCRAILICPWRNCRRRRRVESRGANRSANHAGGDIHGDEQIELDGRGVAGHEDFEIGSHVIEQHDFERAQAFARHDDAGEMLTRGGNAAAGEREFGAFGNVAREISAGPTARQFGRAFMPAIHARGQRMMRMIVHEPFLPGAVAGDGFAGAPEAIKETNGGLGFALVGLKEALEKFDKFFRQKNSVRVVLEALQISAARVIHEDAPIAGAEAANLAAAANAFAAAVDVGVKFPAECAVTKAAAKIQARGNLRDGGIHSRRGRKPARIQ